jgi:hypothetical protein
MEPLDMQKVWDRSVEQVRNEDGNEDSEDGCEVP